MIEPFDLILLGCLVILVTLSGAFLLALIAADIEQEVRRILGARRYHVVQNLRTS